MSAVRRRGFYLAISLAHRMAGLLALGPSSKPLSQRRYGRAAQLASNKGRLSTVRCPNELTGVAHRRDVTPSDHLPGRRRRDPFDGLAAIGGYEQPFGSDG